MAKANKHEGEVSVVLDKERNLKYTLNSLVYIEEQGVDIQNMDKADGMKLSDLRVLIYAGLMHEDADLTPEFVGENITVQDIPVISVALNKAFGTTGK